MITLCIFKQGIVKLIIVLGCVDLLQQVSTATIVNIVIKHASMVTMMTAIGKLNWTSLILIKLGSCRGQISRYEVFSSGDSVTAPSSLL